MSLYAKIRKEYSDFILDIELETNNDTLALLGASGCGKSLTLKCIAGIVEPDEGEIILNGTMLFSKKKSINLPVQKRKIGYLFQNYALFPNMTVQGNVLTGLCQEKMSKAEKIVLVNNMLDKFMISDLKNHKISQLSGGQQQRTALARILIGNPDMLMLDEPFCALDSYLKTDMEKVLRKTISQLQKDTIYVSHDRDEVYRICDRVAVYNNGKIDICSSVENLFCNPVTVNAARLTGCKNIVAAKFVESGTVYVPDWSVKLKVLSNYENKNSTSIGIRAHYFEIVETMGENCIEVLVEYIVKEPFEDTVYFKVVNGIGEICFKIHKEAYIAKNKHYYLYVDPNKIYMLI